MTFKNFKISFCIVCMNRLHQLKETLLQNINDNQEYENLEFLVLNYNSADGMDEWIKENMQTYLSTGRINYHHTTEPNTFSHSHSKNLAFKLASGEIVCNVNADHYTGKGFASYVNTQFNLQDRIVLTTVDYFKTKPGYNPAKDVFGKVCVKKTDFLKIRGFDERMTHYGFEDWDFVNRLEMDACKRVFIEEPAYLNFISHGQEERYSTNMDHVFGIYLQYLTPSLSDIIFLFKDGKFEKGLLVDNSTIDSSNWKYAYQQRNNRFEYSLKEKRWIHGSWNLTNNELILLSETTSTTVFSLNQDFTQLKDREKHTIYYLITDKESKENMITFNHFYHNRSLMEIALEEKDIKVNRSGFGKAEVQRKHTLDTKTY